MGCPKVTGVPQPQLAPPVGAGVDAVQLIARMMVLPWTIFAYWFETVLHSMGQLEGQAGRSTAAAPSEPSAPAGARALMPAGLQPTNNRAQETATAPTFAREAMMSDTSLSDDMVKLVRYTIVNIERDREAIIARGEEIVTDDMSDDAFASWMIAKHIPADGFKGKNGHGDEDTRKTLRVCYEVLGRWPKQDRKYEKRQLEILEGIKEALANG